MSNRRYTQFYQTSHKSVVQLDCNFTVASTDSGGLGITGLVGAGIENVFMNTTVTGAGGVGGAGAGGFVNPNPAAGIILVQFQDNFNYYIGGRSQLQMPNSGSSILVASAGVTAQTTYVITILGTTTTAGWQSLGLPLGVTPAVGVAFVASATTTAAGTGAVQVQKSTASGVGHIQIIGSPQLTINSGIGAETGASTGPYIIYGAYSTNALTAPATGTRIYMEFLFSNSSIQNKGY